MIDISGLDKSAVLCALYDHARPQGWGWLHATPDPLDGEVARQLLTRQTYFDYLGGRALKVELKGSTFDPWLYDRDNGEGAAGRAIESLRVAGEREH